MVEPLQESFINRNNMYHALFTTMDRGGIVSILVFDKINGEAVFEDFSETLRETLKDAYMIWGAVYALEKDNIKHSYRSTVEMAQYRFIYPNKKELRYEDIGIEGRKGTGSHLKLF